MSVNRMLTRRTLLKASAAGAVAWAGALASGSDCDATIYRGDGPFYPQQEIPASFDLTALTGGSGRANGQVLYVFGTVRDRECQPVAGARVEIWQADTEGRYKHEGQRHSGPLDPNFQYFGQVQTGSDGHYLFKTIVPATYRVGGLNRAPHIHYKVKSEPHRLLSTELYFAGDESLMAGDEVFQSIPVPKRPSLIAEKRRPGDLTDVGVDFEAGSLGSRFDLVVTAKGNK